MQGLASQIAHRVADNLEPVALSAVPIEITPLIDHLNTLFLRLKQAYEREQRFASDASHELHTPLAALRTQAQVALKTVDKKERFLQLQQIIASVDRCTHIIQQLLVLCRLSPERIMSEHFSEIALKQLVSEVIAQLAPSAVSKGIDIEMVADDTTRLFMGNATGLYAMVRNLIDNAIRYIPEKGIIKILVEYKTDHTYLNITDNGPGIPIELRSRVFERFFRVLGTNVQGSGLGLSIVEEVVQQHKGTITLATAPEGQGLSVTVLLPYS
jgi:two-component system, OmpR family, sensor histidine kinase QseC